MPLISVKGTETFKVTQVFPPSVDLKTEEEFPATITAPVPVHTPHFKAPELKSPATMGLKLEVDPDQRVPEFPRANVGAFKFKIPEEEDNVEMA
jgi:hypothetical protein